MDLCQSFLSLSVLLLVDMLPSIRIDALIIIPMTIAHRLDSCLHPAESIPLDSLVGDVADRPQLADVYHPAALILVKETVVVVHLALVAEQVAHLLVVRTHLVVLPSLAALPTVVVVQVEGLI